MEKAIYLFVCRYDPTEEEPVCKMTSNSFEVNIGANDCGLEPTVISIQCVLRFMGSPDNAPKMEWSQMGSSKYITSGISQTAAFNTRRESTINSTLYLSADKIKSGTQFMCELGEWNWTSGSIQTIGEI